MNTACRNLGRTFFDKGLQVEVRVSDWWYRLTQQGHRVGVRWKARQEVAWLRHHSHPIAEQLANVLEDALAPVPDELVASFASIEALRARLLKADTSVTYDDYGAGSLSDASVTRPLRDICRASAPSHEARILFHLIHHFQPEACLELGTCLGISAAYQGMVLARNGKGHLVTLEGGETLAALARQHLAGLNLTTVTVVSGRFEDTLPDVLDTYGPFAYAFVDGHHDPEATLAYFRQLMPYLADQAILVFDDIAWSTGMRSAWRHIMQAPEVILAVDLLAFGVIYYDRNGLSG